jgi:Skp family chaperone for outer membrane proteins
LLVLAVFYMGKPRVGIINLGRVASELGVEQKIVEDAQKWRENAAEDFQKLKAEYQTLGKGVQAKAAGAQSDEAKLALRQEVTEATKDYYESSAKVRARVAKHQQEVLQTFRNRLDPFVREVSRKRRLWLGLDQSARLVYATSKIDITDEVIKKAKPTFAEQTDLIDEELSEKDLPGSVLDANSGTDESNQPSAPAAGEVAD